MHSKKIERALPVALVVALSCLIAPRQADARYVRNTTRTHVNPNVNRTRNVNRDYHRDIDVDVDRGHYHPVARAAGVAAAATVTAVAVGSIVNSIPPSCSTAMINGFTYENCDGTWYQPRYSGTQVQYVVVNPPR